MKKISLLIAAVILTASAAIAQIHNPVKWKTASKKISNTEAVVFIQATIQSGWHIYAQNVPDGGPIPTSFTFKSSKDYALNGATAPSTKPKSKFEDVFKMNVPYFSEEIVFQQKVKLNGKGPTTVSGTVEFMACDKTQCLPPDEHSFTVTIK